jgi:hypothetical protein
MKDYGKEFDSILDSHSDTRDLGKSQALEQLLSDIKLHKVTEVYQVESLIQGQLDALKATQYEAEARADHITEQIPNV